MDFLIPLILIVVVVAFFCPGDSHHPASKRGRRRTAGSLRPDFRGRI